MPPKTVPPVHRQSDAPNGRRVLYLTGGTDLPSSDDALVFTLAFVELTEAELARIAPDLVVFPLFSSALDATLVLTKLNALGFRGHCVILAPRLPKPKMIEAELREYSGSIQVEILASDAAME